MSKDFKLHLICLFLLSIYILSNLSSVESTQNDSESASSLKHRIQKRIVRGRYTVKHRHTIVRLDYNYGLDFCTGTFIAPNAILTAAHCCKVRSVLSIYNFPRNRTLNVPVRKYHIHPDYESYLPFSHHDIAIIELTKSIKSVIPAKLDYSGVSCGEDVWMYGYGRAQYNRPVPTVKLKVLLAQVVDCDGTGWPLPDKPIYTSSRKGAVCKGDSGGPMFNRKGKVIGVHVAATNDNCKTSQFTADVLLSFYKRFIQTALRQKSTYRTPKSMNLTSTPTFTHETPNSTAVSENTLHLKPVSGLYILFLFIILMMLISCINLCALCIRN